MVWAAHTPHHLIPDIPHPSFPTVPALLPHPTSIPTILPHPISTLPTPHHFPAHPLTPPPHQKSCPDPGSRRPVSEGCGRSLLPPAAVWVLQSSPSPPPLGFLPSKAPLCPGRAGLTLWGEGSQGIRRSEAQHQPYQHQHLGRGRAAVEEGQPHAGEGGPAVPQEKESRLSWDAASRTSKGRAGRRVMQCVGSPAQGWQPMRHPNPFPGSAVPTRSSTFPWLSGAQTLPGLQ